MATGTVVITERAIKQVHMIKFAWTSTAGGAASDTTRLKYTGNILKFYTVPGSGGDAPTDNYDITLTNADSIDVLQGQGANRSTSLTQWVNDIPASTPLGAVAGSKLTLNVSNAGDANTGELIVFIGVGKIWEHEVDIENALYGTTGISSFPAAAVPANGVSLAEVIRSVWAGLMGTATGENGITTFPAAAAAGNAVSLAEVIRYIQESQVGSLANSGGTATLAAILGDVANSDVATRLTNLANQVARTTAAKAQASVASADLFTVAGGPVRVLSIVGQITTVIETKTINTKLTHTATGGSAVDLCATADITAAAARKLLTITGIKANALQISTDAGIVTLANQVGMPIVLTAGTIAVSASATGTGAISWYIEYEPLVPGATVTAA